MANTMETTCPNYGNAFAHTSSLSRHVERPLQRTTQLQQHERTYLGNLGGWRANDLKRHVNKCFIQPSEEEEEGLEPALFVYADIEAMRNGSGQWYKRLTTWSVNFSFSLEEVEDYFGHCLGDHPTSTRFVPSFTACENWRKVDLPTMFRLRQGWASQAIVAEISWWQEIDSRSETTHTDSNDRSYSLLC